MMIEAITDRSRVSKSKYGDRRFNHCAWCIAAGFLFIAGHVIAQVTAQGSSTSGNSENGRSVYLKDGCYECHGSVGQGGTGPRLGPRPLAVAAFIGYVRKPAGVMPPYSTKILSDKELADILAYLSSVPAPPSAGSIRILNQ